MPIVHKCPFFAHEGKLGISCEDTFHAPSDKDAWVKSYCAEDYIKCKYYQKIKKQYDKHGELSVDFIKAQSGQSMRLILGRLGLAESKLYRYQSEAEKSLKQAETALKTASQQNRLRIEAERKYKAALQVELEKRKLVEAMLAYVMDEAGIEELNPEKASQYAKEYKINYMQIDNGLLLLVKNKR